MSVSGGAGAWFRFVSAGVLGCWGAGVLVGVLVRVLLVGVLLVCVVLTWLGWRWRGRGAAD